MYEQVDFTTARILVKVVFTAAAPAVLTLFLAGCGITEPGPFESIVGNWTGSGGGLRLDVTFDEPECGYTCVGDGSGSWSFGPTGESGTITGISFPLPVRSEKRLITGDELYIGLVDFPNGLCFDFRPIVVDERTLTGWMVQICGGLSPLGVPSAHVGIDMEFTLTKL